MHHAATVSIDFGSSYTKVGFRGACELHAPGSYNEDASLLLVDGSPLIPTLVIKTGMPDRPWVFGNDAANLSLAAGMTPFQNWKAGLFNRSNNPDTAQSTIIAEAFFRWLRSKIEPAAGGFHGKTVRIMLPAFRDFGDLAGVVARCMEMADWKPARLVVGTEPHANALGIMTNGHNRYNRGTVREGPDFMGMYGHSSPFISAARAAVLRDGASRELRVAIVDIGAFTTDLAMLAFDVMPDARGDGLKQVKQESFPVGAHDHLNEPLWQQLGARYNASFGSLNFRVKEEIKRALFAGESYALLFGEKRREIGGPGDADIIAQLTSQFADAIWSVVEKPLTRARVSTLYLTGGGSQVHPLVEALRVRGAKNFRTVRPNGPVPAGAEGTAFAPWGQSGEAIERVATALGGCSILAPTALDRAPIIDLLSPLSSRKQEQGKLVRCTCGGMNPGCSICDGAGYLPTKESTS